MPVEKEITLGETDETDETDETVTAGAIEAAFQEYTKVHIASEAGLSLGEKFTIPGGKKLVIWGNRSVSTSITVGDGKTEGLLCVPETATLTAGDIYVTANSRLEDHGTLSCTKLTGEANTELINNQNMKVTGNICLKRESALFNHGDMFGDNIVSEGNAYIVNDSVISLNGAYTYNTTSPAAISFDEYNMNGSTDALLISKGKSSAMPDGSLLMTAQDSSGSNKYYYYAEDMDKNVIENMNLAHDAISGQVTWNFAKDAVIPEKDGVGFGDFHANMNEHELQVEGTLTISGGAIIEGCGEATVRLKGGSLILDGDTTSTKACTIKNTATGCAIVRDSGMIRWNDPNAQILSKGGSANIIQGVDISEDGIMSAVTLKEYSIETTGDLYCVIEDGFYILKQQKADS